MSANSADGVTVTANNDEIAISYPGVGALFISKVAGKTIIEATAIANPGEPRHVVRKRHLALLAHAEALFGEVERHDPRNLTGLASRKMGAA